MNDVPAAAAPHDDWLDAALRADGRDHRDQYLTDDGFTARAAASLPAADTAPAWRRPALIGLWALAGIGGAFALPGAFADVAREVYRMFGAHPVAISEVAVSIALLGSVALAAAAWVLRED
jgi:di/tricarboxylate transporter